MQVDCVLTYHLCEPYIYAAVNSALWQTHANLVLHIVDDTGGEGWNKELNQKFQDPRIRFYKNEKNIGYYMSVNSIFSNFKGELFFVFDSDDISPNWRIADALEIYQKESFDVYTGGTRIITQSDEITDYYGIPSPPVLNKDGLIISGKFYNPTCAIRREYFNELNGYSNCFVGGDRDFVIKSHYYGAKFYYDSKRVMAYRRTHLKQVTKTDATGMHTHFRWKITQKTAERTKKYYLGGVKRRIRKCGMLRLTKQQRAILI